MSEVEIEVEMVGLLEDDGSDGGGMVNLSLVKAVLLVTASGEAILVLWSS